MSLLKSFPYKTNPPDYTLSFVSLVVFSLFCAAASWGGELLLSIPTSSLSLIQRYLLFLMGINGVLGLISRFKTSYLITCQILLFIFFVMSTIQTFFHLGCMYRLSSLQAEISEMLSLLCSQKSFTLLNIPFPFFNALGSMSVFLLLLRYKEKACM
jgi:hypothetical protein